MFLPPPPSPVSEDDLCFLPLSDGNVPFPPVSEDDLRFLPLSDGKLFPFPFSDGEVYYFSLLNAVSFSSSVRR